MPSQISPSEVSIFSQRQSFAIVIFSFVCCRMIPPYLVYAVHVSPARTAGVPTLIAVSHFSTCHLASRAKMLIGPAAGERFTPDLHIKKRKQP